MTTTTVTIDTADLPAGLAVVVIAVTGGLAVQVGSGYTVEEVVANLGPALSHAITLTEVNA